MIKILTGYSNPGGSTIAFLNLSKKLISKGYDVTLYGPHKWHITQGSFCKLSYKNLFHDLNKDDKLILHFVSPDKKSIDVVREIGCKIIYSCHEMEWFNFRKILKCYDTVQFVTQEQANYHNSVTDYVIIPNIREEIKINRSSNVKNVAGIIGSVEPRKRTHESIKRALDDGCDKVLIFGPLTNLSYFNKLVKPLLNNKVRFIGYCSKEIIYSTIDRVYHSSVGEVASLVKDECYTTNTLFFGNEYTDNIVSTLTNDEIIDKWKHLFETIQ